MTYPALPWVVILVVSMIYCAFVFQTKMNKYGPSSIEGQPALFFIGHIISRPFWLVFLRFFAVLSVLAPGFQKVRNGPKRPKRVKWVNGFSWFISTSLDLDLAEVAL